MLIDTNNITTEENLIDFLLDQYEETKNHMFLTAANNIALYRRDVNFLAFCLDRSNKWISVEDRLPECEWGAESEAVLYITKQGFMYTGYYGCGGIFHDRYFREYKNAYEGCDISNVTHWMPLPAPPTEKES